MSGISRSLLLSFWVITIIVDNSMANILQFEGKQLNLFENKLLTSNLVQTKDVRSRLECVNNCILNIDCTVISYNRATRSCRLYSSRMDLIDVNNDAVSILGWKSTNIEEGWCSTESGFVHNRKLDLCYKLIPGKVSCTTAYTVCSDLQADVIILDTVAKNNYITNEIASSGTIFKEVRLIYKGDEEGSAIDQHSTMTSCWMNAYLSNGEWVWGSGKPLSSTYTNWDTRNPNNVQPQYHPGCVGMANTWSYYWHDFEAHFSFDTICEIRRPS